VTVGSVDARSLLDAWEALGAVEPGDRLFRTRRLDRPSSLDLRTAVRETDGAPCLVALLGQEDTGRVVAFETAGLRLSRSRDEAGILLVLSLEKQDRRDLFAQVCADVVRSVVQVEETGERDLLGTLAERVAAWRAFLRDQSGSLARHEIVGLVGELLVLARMLDRSTDAVSAWASPDDGLHDFERDGRAIEVKTSLGAARRLTASSLDQLDEGGLGSLHVAHVRLMEDPDGETVVDVARGLERRLPGDRERRDFRNALLRRGLAPDTDERAGPRVRELGIEFYRVDVGFPRLRRAEVHQGIVEATYDIEVRTLGSFLIDAEAVLDGMWGGNDG